MGRWMGLGVVVVLGLLCGCTHMLAEQMVAAPNNRLHGDSVAAAPPVGAMGSEGRLNIPVGPPDASLAAWVLEPKKGPVRGTVLVLHGFLGNHYLVRGAADALCAAGYRAVLVDLRGHGDSTGDHITFGVTEARDLAQLTDYLQAHKLAGKTIGVYGTSLGAAVAIQYAGIDPRVSAVVAVASFATLREEAAHFGRTMLPIPGLFMSESQYVEVLRDAGEIAHFNPDQASPLAAIAHTKARVLLIHGGIDNVIPVEDSQRLHAAAPDRTELVVLPAYGHLTACADPLSEVAVRACDFFKKHLSGQAVNEP